MLENKLIKVREKLFNQLKHKSKNKLDVAVQDQEEEIVVQDE